MRIVLSIVLIIAHLFSTIGVHIEMHQCGDEISYSVFNIHLNDHCECDHESNEHEDDCCSSKKVEVKSIKDSKIIKDNQIDLKSSTLFISLTKVYYSITKDFEATNEPAPLCTEDPPDKSVSLFLLFNCFRI